MKIEFKQWWSSIPPISIKRTITSGLNRTQKGPRRMLYPNVTYFYGYSCDGNCFIYKCIVWSGHDIAEMLLGVGVGHQSIRRCETTFSYSTHKQNSEKQKVVIENVEANLLKRDKQLRVPLWTKMANMQC